MSRQCTLALPILLLLVHPPAAAVAQSEEPRFSVGPEYRSLKPHASGLGLSVTARLVPRLALALQSNYYLPTDRTRSSAFTETEFEERLWTVDLSFHVTPIRWRGLSVYGSFGLQYRLSWKDGTYTTFNDVPPYGTTTSPFEATDRTLARVLGGGLSAGGRMQIFVEPEWIFADPRHVSVSGGLRVGL